MTRDEFDRAWIVLSGALPQVEIPSLTKELYFNRLADLDGQRFVTGILFLVEDDGFRNDRVPTIAQLRASCPTLLEGPKLTKEQIEWRKSYFERYSKKGISDEEIEASQREDGK